MKCPIDKTECNKKECAIWIETYGCAVLRIAKELEYIANSLRKSGG